MFAKLCKVDPSERCADEFVKENWNIIMICRRDVSY